MRKLTIIPAALLLAGCTAPAEPVLDTFPAPPEPVTYSATEPFTFTTDDGAHGTIQFGAEPYAAFANYMDALGNTGTYSYATVNVDNRNGAAPIDSIAATAYTPEGTQHECVHPMNVLTDHVPEEPTTEQQIDLYYGLFEYPTVSVGEVETVRLVCVGEVPTEVSNAAFRTMGNEYPAVQ